MPKLTDRIVALLRVMHAGIPLRVLPKGTAMLDITRIPQGIRRATVEQMASDGLIEFDVSRERYIITEAGRDQVRVRDHVDEFIQSI